MPYTFSHPAIVLPLLSLPKRWRSATGLVIGSITPDFEKFITMSENDPHSHTFYGIFYFNLPVGLALSFIFHLLIRDSLIKHLPSFLYQRYSIYTSFDWVKYFKDNYFVFLFSLFIGILSHVVFDSLTYPVGHREPLFPFLEPEALSSPLGENMSYRVQFIVFIVGMLCIGLFILKLPQHSTKVASNSIFLYWMKILAVTGLITYVRSRIGDGIKPDFFHPIIVITSAGLLSLIIVPILIKTFKYFKS